MKIALILALLFFAGIFFLRRKSEKEDAELEKEFASTKIVGDSRELQQLGYKPLVNVVRHVDSIMCPRPGWAIRDYKKKGYEVVLCQEARDMFGKDVSKDTLSLWGKMKDGSC